MKRPAFQFYPADWRKDMALQSCSVAARGLWMDMLCIAHECEPYGHLTVNGKAMSAAQIGRHTGLTERECQRLIVELDDAGVSSRTDDGTIYSRRMVRDEDLRQRRAEGGKAGSEHGAKGAEHGHKGGRPPKERGDKKPPLEPPPSSSSSTSVGDTPIPPAGADLAGDVPGTRGRGKSTAIGLKAWLEAVKARGEKPIPPDDPVFAYAASAGIPDDFLALAWCEFKHRYCQPDAKRYRDWRSVFRKAVRGNWLKLWFVQPDGAYALTTVGIQAQRSNDDRRAA